jgi:hypothetical protein
MSDTNKSYDDKVKCPKGHTFRLLRRRSTAGKKVRTYCQHCERAYQIVAGPLPKEQE